MHAIFVRSLSYGGVMNTDLSCGMGGLQFLFLDKSSLLSWGIFVLPATSGKVHLCSMFSPYVFTVVHWSPKALEMA